MKRRIYACIFLFVSIAAHSDIPLHNPKVTIITSLYDGDKFIKGFMEDITRQTVFHECELVIVDAHSPGNEYKIIKPYIKQFPNIIYIKLQYDPGIYAVWNMVIRMARGKYLTNANVDDRLHPRSIEIHAQELDKNPHIDLVYSNCFWSEIPNQTFEECMQEEKMRILSYPHFERNFQYRVGNHPMWRKSVHTKYGMFNEQLKVAGDWEFTLRLAKHGAKFKKIDALYGVYYKNPKGLSTNEENSRAVDEAHLVMYWYRDFMHTRLASRLS